MLRSTFISILLSTSVFYSYPLNPTKCHKPLKFLLLPEFINNLKKKKNQGLRFPNMIKGNLDKTTSDPTKIYLENIRIIYLKFLHLFHRYQAPWCVTGKLLLTVANEFQARVPGYHLVSVSEGRTTACYEHICASHIGSSGGRGVVYPVWYGTSSYYICTIFFHIC